MWRQRQANYWVQKGLSAVICANLAKKRVFEYFRSLSWNTIIYLIVIVNLIPKTLTTLCTQSCLIWWGGPRWTTDRFISPAFGMVYTSLRAADAFGVLHTGLRAAAYSFFYYHLFYQKYSHWDWKSLFQERHGLEGSIKT